MHPEFEILFPSNLVIVISDQFIVQPILIMHLMINIQVHDKGQKAKENSIGEQCSEIEENLRKNNSKKAYQLMKDLTTVKRGKATTIQDRSGKCLTEEQQILNQWTEYCSELYNYKANGDPSVLNRPQTDTKDDHPILHKEVEAAIQSLRKGKSAGVDNFPAELVQAGGEDVITAFMAICNKIWQTGEWPTPWTQSLVIILPKKGNLQQCQNYWTISLISHPSSHAEDHIEQIETTSGEDHCLRTGRLQSRKEYHRADLQPMHSMWEISPAPGRPLPCLHRLQEGLRQGLACSFVGNHEEVQHQHKPYPSHQKPL